MQRIVGLTGGIATGKSTVARRLAVRGVPVVDADVLAREAVIPGSPILKAIAGRYGAEVLQADGSLDRAALARIIFADPDERRWVEGQIHPFVREGLLHGIACHPEAPVICLVVPLLFEAHMDDLATEIWVVACSLATQRERLKRRDGLSDAEVERRLASQMPLAEKVKRANRVLDNDGSPAQLEAQVEQLLAQAST